MENWLRQQLTKWNLYDLNDCLFILILCLCGYVRPPAPPLNTLQQELCAVTAAVSHWLFLLLPRLLRSLIGLKRVIINAAHFLVMKNKDFYRFYQTEPFLETVRGHMEGPFFQCINRSLNTSTGDRIRRLLSVFPLLHASFCRMTGVLLKTLCLSAL